MAEQQEATNLCLRVRSSADVAVTVMRARHAAREAGFDEEASVAIATAASELATNLVAHAGGGTLTLGLEQRAKGLCLTLVSEDNGPGIEDIERALTPHFSTAGTLGLGLPGIQRLMDELSISSAPALGTRVQVRKYLHGNR